MSNVLKLGEVSPTFPRDNSHWISSTSVVIAKVKLGANVGIWYGTILRGDNEIIDIGDDTNVQEQVMMHTDIGYPLIVGRGCTIGHRALLHGCEIGNNTLVGMGAMIMNGAKIGQNCLIGAGALVTEGKEIPDGSLVLGVPAKIKRELTNLEIRQNEMSAHHYIQAMRRIRDESLPV